MSKIRFYLALWLAKLSVLALKITRHNGTNFPGIVALKVCPDFLRLIQKPSHIIGVTGTNGKTTVCNLVEDMLRADGRRVLNNSMGSNINTGIATALLGGVNLLGKSRYDLAVLEIDERSAPLIFPAVKPDLLLINNMTRDSIMRNGHPQFIARLLTEEIPPQTRLLLNGDDLITVGIAPDNPRRYFGIRALPTDVDRCINLINDVRICPVCGSVLTYEHIRYHHIGKAHCPVCGLTSPACDYEAETVDTQAMTMTMRDADGLHTYRLLNDSVFNIYNVVAATSLMREMGYEAARVAQPLQQVQIVKSRFHETRIGTFTVVRQMSKDKNALGASRAFDYVSSRPGDKELILMMNCLHDQQTWSENVCWLYDADFEFLNKDDIKTIVVTGPRAKDYRLRLLMAGVPEARIRFAEKEMDAPAQLRLTGNESIYLFNGTDSIALGDKVEAEVTRLIQQKMKARGESAVEAGASEQAEAAVQAETAGPEPAGSEPAKEETAGPQSPSRADDGRSKVTSQAADGQQTVDGQCVTASQAVGAAETAEKGVTA